MTLEQPTLEFLLADKFGIIQTGKRPLQNLTARFVGQATLDFPIDLPNNELFGQAFSRRDTGYLYIDAAGTGLQFTGSTNQVTSFTVGLYMCVPQTINMIWGEIVHHNYDGYGDVDWAHYRLMPHLQTGGSPAQVAYLSLGSGVQYPLSLDVPLEKRSGWVHVTFTYDATSGALKGYLDGAYLNQATVSNWQAAGNNGAYVSHTSNPFICFFLFLL